ncbi:MAG: hypothetical protein ACI89X_004524 [Planctomycetota bacterium]|jgi:hypothetical protein
MSAAIIRLAALQTGIERASGSETGVQFFDSYTFRLETARPTTD